MNIHLCNSFKLETTLHIKLVLLHLICILHITKIMNTNIVFYA